MPKKTTANKSRHAVVVLGMHRSGTSALAGVLARLGCDLPEALMPANEFNPKGFYESLKAYNLNDAILASGGSSWDDWQTFNPGWFRSPRVEEFLERGARVLQDEYGKSRLFVLKDPRICRLMPFWTRLFDEQKIQPAYVLAHRNPIEVARSLETREGWPQATGLLLWLRHVLEAEAGSRGARRCFTSYERLLNNWSGVAQSISQRTGISFPRLSDSVRAEIDDFLSGDLRHSVEKVEAVSGNPMVSDWVQTTFEIMERWAEAGESEADLAHLDEIRDAFDKAAPIFSPLFHALRSRGARDVAALEKATVEREAELRHAAEKYHELEGQKGEAERANEQLTIRLEELEKTTAEREAELCHAAEKYHELESQKGEAERANEQLTTRLEESAENIEALSRNLKQTEENLWQTRSSLEQRNQEIKDTLSQSAQAAARADALATQLENLQAEQASLRAERDSLLSEQARLVAEHDQLRKNARLMRRKLQEDFEAQLKTELTAQRRHADNRIAELQRDVESLTEDRDRAISEHGAQAEILHQQHQRIAELEHVAEAYLNSTSWKITAPLRRIVRALRG